MSGLPILLGYLVSKIQCLPSWKVTIALQVGGIAPGAMEGVGMLEITRPDWLWTTNTSGWHLPLLELEWGCKPSLLGTWYFPSKRASAVFSIPYALLKPHHSPIRGGAYFPSSLTRMSSCHYCPWLPGWIGCRESDPVWLLRWWGFLPPGLLSEDTYPGAQATCCM